jgi:replicative superfamily II helicase
MFFSNLIGFQTLFLPYGVCGMRFDLLEAFGLDPGIIAILKEKYGPELLPIQEKAFKEHHILSGGNFIIFAVTSAGKTLVGEILSLFNAGKGKRVFYLVPTKALAEESSSNSARIMKRPASAR